MFSGDVSRLTESGHAALTCVLICAVLERYDRVQMIGRGHLDGLQDGAVDGRGRVARSTESGHSGLTGELIRATLQRYDGVRGSQLSHRPTFPTRLRRPGLLVGRHTGTG